MRETTFFLYIMVLFLLSNILMLLMVVSFIWEGLAWREALSGKIALDSLRLVTGILDKMKLIKIFGAPDQSLNFSASIWQIIKARSLINWVIGNKLVELYLLYILWKLTWVDSSHGWRNFSLVMGYYLLAYGIYSYKSRKIGYQFTHEKLKRFGPEVEATGFRFDHLGGSASSNKTQTQTQKEEDES